ncbi:MAG TPA: DUF4251 domain-containing protein [Mucilaginibacter sp.]|nr:DUF4251 domain-containing protein [Mucilaginibacter sp.]
MKVLSNLFVFALVLWGANTVMAQSSLKDDKADKAKEVKSLINGGRYTFEATREMEKKGGSMSMRPGDLDISKDTLIAYLPDAGKAPGTPDRPRDAGITCVHYSYHMTQGANGKYAVSIKPEEKYARDVRKIKEITMYINKEGYADVTVHTTNHGRMRFHGYIKEHEANFPPVNRVAMR